MTTNGRYLFLNFDANGFGGDSCHRADLQNLKDWTRIYSPQFPFPTNIRGLSIGADGQVVVVDKGNFSGPDVSFIDPMTGKASSKFGMFPPHFDAYKAVEDPKTRDVVVIARGITSGDVASTWRAGKLLKGPYGSRTGKLKGLTVRRVPWLHRFGHGCSASTADPVMFGNSVPELGNSKYAVTLSAAANSPGMLMLGIHGHLKKPVPLASIGMGTCELGLLPILTLPIAVPATGKLSTLLPIPSSLGPADIDVQILLRDKNANNAGLITTRTGSMIIR